MRSRVLAATPALAVGAFALPAAAHAGAIAAVTGNNEAVVGDFDDTQTQQLARPFTLPAC